MKRPIWRTITREQTSAPSPGGKIQTRKHEGFVVETPADIVDLCTGLATLQRAGCVTVIR